MSIRHLPYRVVLFVVIIFLYLFTLPGVVLAQSEDNPNPPESPVRLIFIHHSTGENWLRDGYGNLGRTLGENNYFVSDTNYGWGQNSIGDRTDIVNWVEWFGAERNENILNDLYNESEQHAEYTRTLANPGGQNEIIMFKSCFPNSDLGGNPNDPPGDYADMTVGGAKFVYNQILQYFATRPDKLFIVITAPPLSDATHAANARAFNEWLMNDWLQGYKGNNVAVFDFFNVLTGKNHHHRWQNGKIEHIYTPGANTLVYPSEDDHPSAAGSQKATTEFIPLLNIFYHRWKAGAPASPPSTTQADSPPVEVEEPQPGGIAAPSIMIEDFEKTDVEWHHNSSEGPNTTIQCATDKTQFHGGSASLKIDYTIDPGGYVDCGHSFDEARDMGSAGLSFWLRSAQPDGTMTVTLVSGDQNTPFDSEVTLSPESSAGWVNYRLPWSNFTKAGWAGEEGLAALDPTNVNGIDFSIGAGETQVKGTIWIDDIQLAGAGENSESAPPTPAEEAAPTSKPPAAVEKAEPEAAPADTKPVSNRICPLPTIALPLGVIFFMLLRKRSAII